MKAEELRIGAFWNKIHFQIRQLRRNRMLQSNKTQPLNNLRHEK